MDNKRIVIYGGGTVFHVKNHLALCAPAYGTTARKLAALARTHLPKMDVVLRLTKMAGGTDLETNLDVAADIQKQIADDRTKVIIMNAAICDFIGKVNDSAGKYSGRLKSSNGPQYMTLIPVVEKILSSIRKTRKDIFLVGFKTTCGASDEQQYIEALDVCKKSSCNLVFANDTGTRNCFVVTPEEAKYFETDPGSVDIGVVLEKPRWVETRDEALEGLMQMIFHRTHLTFTRSTVVDGKPVPWDSPEVPESLRTVVNYCIQQNAYKPFNGSTAGHFAVKLSDTTFLSSIRKTDFNNLNKVGLVKVVTDGPDTVLAYGAKPSVGGQSQRIVFHDHPEMDCIVHAHVPIKPGSEVPAVSQWSLECGSHECGQNTSNGLKQFGNLKAVYLEEHGPNIVFNHNIDPQEVINFIDANFDLSQKTGGFVSLSSRLETPSTFETAQVVLQ